jgi:hypothetical protein
VYLLLVVEMVVLCSITQDLVLVEVVHHKVMLVGPQHGLVVFRLAEEAAAQVE